MATAVWTPTAPGQIKSLALDTNAGTFTLRNANAAARYFQFWSDSAWLYSDASAGTYAPIAAGQVLTLEVNDNNDFSIYAKVASGTATLYGMGARN